MAAYSIGRCSGIFRSVINANIRPAICNAWYGTVQDNVSKKEQPSKPASAFVLFYKDKLPMIKENNPGETKIAVLSKLAGEMWHKLPDNERQKYLKSSQDAMAIYSEKLKNYTAGLSSEQLEEIALNAWRMREEKKIKKAYQAALSKHPMPKRPKPAMWVFGETIDSKNCTLKELNQKVKSGWQGLSYAEKETYVAGYEEKMERWKTDFGLWVQDMVLDGSSDFITMHELKQELRRLGMPKRPITAFMLYTRACRMEQGNMSITEFSKEMGSRWKQLSDEEKQVFNKEWKNEWDNYTKDMSQWKASLNEREATFSELAQKIIKGTLEREIKAAEKMLEKQKEKEKIAKEKEKEQKKLIMQKEKLAKQKEKEKLAKQKEKEKLAKQKEKEKFAKQKAKEQEKLAKKNPK
ncbi:high mobility group B protein 6-like [Pecten maximus]|uniref:high mobility group B protein 6-like n=1 Tax=Pecten maximus TaxID=6579 RepID=UPI0014583953|nr:high mobility group B protein 6-like [Pecten maximus]